MLIPSIMEKYINEDYPLKTEDEIIDMINEQIRSFIVELAILYGDEMLSKAIAKRKKELEDEENDRE